MIKPFSQLDNDYQLFLSTMPMSVYSTINPDDESEDQFVAIRDRFVSLPEDIKDKLASLELADEIKKIGDENNLKLLQMASIARAVRSFYFKDISAESFPAIFQKEMNVESGLAQNISKDVIRRIIQKNFSNNEEYERRKETPLVGGKRQENREIQLPLSQALGQFPDLGEQHVTNNPLKLRYFPAPARPSIKNWITDFHDNMGAGKHSAIDRGNYLFHSENGKKLTPIERQKLSIILKSLDEGMPLTIDGEKQVIIFTELMQNYDGADRGNMEEMKKEQKATIVDKPVMDNLSKTIDHKQSVHDDVFQKYVPKQQLADEIRKPAIDSQSFAKKNEEIKQPAAKSYQSPVADYRQGTISKQQMVEEIQQPKFEEPAVQSRPNFQKPKSEMEIEHENYFSSFASHANNIKFPSKEAAGEKPSSESIKFSSPQEFPVEQKEAAVKKEEEPKIQPKTVVQSEPQPKKEEPEKSQTDYFFQSQIAHFPQSQQNKKAIQSRWQIKPSSYHEENDDAKIAGNIVDLRN